MRVVQVNGGSQVHHVRALRDLNVKGQRAKSLRGCRSWRPDGAKRPLVISSPPSSSATPLTRSPGAHAPTIATHPHGIRHPRRQPPPHLAHNVGSRPHGPHRRPIAARIPAAGIGLPPENFFSICSCNATPQLQIRLPLASSLSYDGPWQKSPKPHPGARKTQESAGDRRGGDTAVDGGSGAGGRCLQRCGSWWRIRDSNPWSPP